MLIGILLSVIIVGGSAFLGILFYIIITGEIEHGDNDAINDEIKRKKHTNNG